MPAASIVTMLESRPPLRVVSDRHVALHVKSDAVLEDVAELFDEVFLGVISVDREIQVPIPLEPFGSAVPGRSAGNGRAGILRTLLMNVSWSRTY
jgi:hypothetical protein